VSTLASRGFAELPIIANAMRRTHRVTIEGVDVPSYGVRTIRVPFSGKHSSYMRSRNPDLARLTVGNVQGVTLGIDEGRSEPISQRSEVYGYASILAEGGFGGRIHRP
jgi:hypothetical protein